MSGTGAEEEEEGEDNVQFIEDEGEDKKKEDDSEDSDKEKMDKKKATTTGEQLDAL